jgi:hypothetical protein
MSGCGSNKPFAPDDPNQTYIALGNGGGFTGKTTTYYILNNGQVYKGSDFSNEFSQIGKINKRAVAQNWSTYNNLPNEAIQINNPGNYYYFLEFKQGNKINRMVWQELTEDAALIQTMYSNLNNTINKITKERKVKKS